MKSKIERLHDKIAKKEAELQKEKEKLQTLLTDAKTHHSVTQYKEQFKALGAEIEYRRAHSPSKRSLGGVSEAY